MHDTTPTLRWPPRDPKLLDATLDAALIVNAYHEMEQHQFVAGHIPGAIWIPLSSVDRSVEQLRALAKPVVTYCS